MKIFGFALALGSSCVVAAPLFAAPPAMPLDPSPNTRPTSLMLQRTAYGDAPMPGRHRGGRKKGPSAKSVDPTLPSMKGVSQENADKQYKSKYGF